MDSDQPDNAFALLTEEQRKELLLAYEESFDENNLIPHELVKKEHEKWLRADQ